ncbi:hypothetical protein QJ48_09175 [Paenibacillus sp. A3]|uniref:ATP-grasp domain-containing protein n=1 Tax=Paenibacillus sp. A3 TaxID=1337054 RepID=UPI0006D53365|nr:ATP-grasp domain-containing protein [Paenibacillus sp. A3]KPV59753.1 hypothetical protein QJ48_09175 [Paenibacillus sp. A3]
MYNILVTGVGAIIGYGIIKSLRNSMFSLNIIGMDIYDDAVGQQWCDHFEKALPANDPEYPEFIRKLVRKHNIHLIIPGIEQDGLRLSKELDFFKDLDVKIVLNQPSLISIASDKWLTHQLLLEHEFDVINSHIEGEYQELSKQLHIPMLVKPRRSYASKGIQKIYTEFEFNFWKSKMREEFMVQEIVGNDDEEYTVGAFGLGNGIINQQIIFQRKLSGEGATSKARVCRINELENLVRNLAQVFQPLGPTNFQFRRKDGVFLLLEINPRISSSTSLRSAFGYNEAEMCIEYYLEGKIPAIRKIKDGYAQRYIEDQVILC